MFKKSSLNDIFPQNVLFYRSYKIFVLKLVDMTPPLPVEHVALYSSEPVNKTSTPATTSFALWSDFFRCFSSVFWHA